MNRCALLFVLVAAPFARGQEYPETLRASLDQAFEQPWQPRYDALFDECTLHMGSVDPLAAELRRIGKDEDRERAATADWIATFVAWRDGRLGDAKTIVDRLLGHRDDAMTRLRHARLLDAQGKADEAAASYRAVLAFDCGEAIESFVRLRLALIELASGSKGESTLLAEWAKAEGRDPVLRNRAANILALIGRSKDACALYEVRGEGGARFKAEVRLATWAIHAELFDRAQEHAWLARTAATTRRDRHYALSVLVESYRADGALDELIERFAAASDLDEASRKVWIDLLRETGRIDHAVELFRSSRDEFSIEMQRELVEMYREAGRDAELVATYRELVAADPERIAWREGLSRFYLERGDTAQALGVWQSFLTEPSLRPSLLAAATSAMELGLTSFATEAAEICIREDRQRHPALLLLFSAHRERGELELARAALDRMDEMAAPDASDRAALSEAYEQLGQLDRAVAILEGLRAARGDARMAEDLEVRLAWLYSQVGDEERAMQRWFELWRRVKSVARRRYVEDRLMTVAARLGKIAKLVVDLETKLANGEADETASTLLVRLYTKVNDPVSAAEVIDEFFQQSGGDDIEAMQEKARVYLECTDYASYEETIRQLIERDPEGEVDYMRSLVMSQLERGRPDEAREELTKLQAHDAGFDRAEFEAGVLALAGLRDEAIDAYRRGIAKHSGRIEIYLLLANLLKETGRTEQAVQMFQHVVDTAEKDDLFTIGIDGLLNMEAPPAVLEWARRVTLERMADKQDKSYLYQLLADLSQELQQRDGVLAALEGSLAIAGSRRPSVLRELMDLAAGDGRAKPDTEKQLAYGRRLIALAEVVPPQVYLDLGQAFLRADEISNAVKTFNMARDLADYAQFRRQVASAYESAGYLNEALRTYKEVLLGSPSDIALLVKIATLEERVGRDAEAFDLYRRSLDLMSGRQLLLTDKNEAEDEDSAGMFWRARNVDATTEHVGEAITGLLVTAADDEAVISELRRQVARLDAAITEFEADERAENVVSIEQAPRLQHLSRLCRRLAFAVCRADLIADVDARLVDALVGDDELLESLCKERMRWGMTVAARELVEAVDRDETTKQRLRFLFGAGGTPPARAIPVAQVASLLLPAIAGNDAERVRTLVQKADLTATAGDDLVRLPVLFAAAQLVGDELAALTIAQSWIRTMQREKKQSYEISQTYTRCSRKLSGDSRRRFDEFFVNFIVRGKLGDLYSVLPELQKRYEEPLLTAEQVNEVIESVDVEYAYGFGALLALLPTEERAAALRSRWPDIAKTERMSFLLYIVGDMKGAAGMELSNFIIDALPDALADHAEPFRYLAYSFTQLRENKENFDLADKIAELVLRSKPDEWAPNMLRAVIRAERGEEAEAVEIAANALREQISKGESYEWSSAVRDIERQFLPTHLDTFLNAIDQRGSLTPDQWHRRMELVRAVDDPVRTLAAAREAVAAHPEDKRLSSALVSALERAERRLEALAELRRISSVHPDDEDLKRRIARKLESFGKPAEALAIYESLDDEDAGSAAADASAKSNSKFENPTIQRVKQFVDDQAFERASREFRRLWRFGSRFPDFDRLIAMGAVIRMSAFGGSNWKEWPAESDADDAARRARQQRRGMDAFVEVEPEDAASNKTYDVLAEHEFGKAEMHRHLRSLDRSGIDRSRDLIDGLLRAEVRKSDEASVLRRMLERVRTGRANRAHLVQVLDLIERNPDVDSSTGGGELLAELARAVDPLDNAQVLRLARVFGGRGEKGAAELMFRWCSLTNANVYGVGNVAEIVRAAKESLDRDRLIQLVEDVLAWSEPEDDWGLESYESLALELWQEIVETDEAARRCRALCERTLDVRKRLRRDSAKSAAALMARSGDVELAIRCLEVALCKLPTDDVEVEYSYWLREYERPGYLSDADLRRFFPLDSSGWADPPAWYRAVAQALETWLTEDRVRPEHAIRALALSSCRSHALGATAESEAILDRLAARQGLRGDDRLWISDAFERIGRADRAFEIRAALLAADQLVTPRIVDVVRELAEREGAEAALALDLVETTHDEAVLRQLAGLARAVGRAEDASAWTDLADRSVAASAALEARKDAD